VLDLDLDPWIFDTERIEASDDVDAPVGSWRRDPCDVVAHRLEKRCDEILKFVGTHGTA
jgi:hypothetical protein